MSAATDARSAGATPLAGPPARERRRVRIGDLAIDRLSCEQAVDAIEGLVASGRGGAVFTPNVDHVVKARRDVALRAAYRSADLVLADGTPLVWTSRLLGAPLPERVAGSDLLGPLMARAVQRGWRVFLLGGAPGDAAAAADVLARRGVAIVAAEAPTLAAAADDAASAEVARRIRDARAELVLVALGVPKQELFIQRHLDALRPAVALGIGGSLAFVAGRLPRAPRWMSRAGLEWLHRLSREPGRLWRRYLVEDPAFVPIVVQSWWRASRSARGARAPERLRDEVGGGT